MKLRMMTYNIQHGLDYNCRLPGRHPGLGHDIDLTQIAAVIRMQGPDIVALNEVRGLGSTWEYTAQAETIAGMLGWHCYFAPAIWFDGTSPYGNAILSRYPLLSAERILIPDPEVKDEDTYYETRCVLRARIAAAGGITVLVSHFGLAQSEKRNAVAKVLELLEEETSPVILMGDFNMEPNDPILAPLLAKMEDAADKISSNSSSFPADNPEIKIDYILTKNAPVLCAEIPAIVASDHRPHTATVEVGE